MQRGWQYPSGASPTIILDTLRDRLLTYGWTSGVTLISTDDGATWNGRYAYVTDVAGKESRLHVAPDGSYIFSGLTTYNQSAAYVSTDGGGSWRDITTDPRMFDDGAFRGIVDILEPSHLRAWDTAYAGYVISSDLGGTWKRLPTAPRDSGQRSVRETKPAPHLLYSSGRAHWYRLDLRTDSGWIATSVPATSRDPVEIGGAVVGISNGGLVVNASYKSAAQSIDTWIDPASGVASRLMIQRVIAVDDSTVMAADERGWIFAIKPHTGAIQRVHAYDDADSGTLTFEYMATHAGRTLVVFGFTNLVPDSMERWRMVELQGASVIRVNSCWVRRTEVRGTMHPLTYLGQRGLFMYSRTMRGHAEAVRTTDLGTTWTHPVSIASDSVGQAFLGVRSTHRSQTGEIILHSLLDHCLRPMEEGAVEVRQHLTSGARVSFRADLGVLARPPTIVSDGDRLLCTGTMLTELHAETGAAIDTLIAHPTSFVRSIGASTLAAGADSLWISTDDGTTWHDRTPSPSVSLSVARGQCSDVVRTRSGAMVCALRGVLHRDSADGLHTARWGGIVRSADDGLTWTIPAELPPDMHHVSRIDVASDGTVIAVAGRISLDTVALVADPMTPTAFLHSTGLFISTDDGLSWSMVASANVDGQRAGDVEPDILMLDNGMILATMHDGALYLSRDHGRTWESLHVPDLRSLFVHALRRESSGAIVVSTTQGAGFLHIPGVTAVAAETDNAHQGTSPRLTQIARRVIGVHVARGPAELRVFSLNGRLVHHEPLGAGEHTFDASMLGSGLHAMEVTSHDGSCRMILAP